MITRNLKPRSRGRGRWLLEARVAELQPLPMKKRTLPQS
jgi:hypothetical protein